jgi:hypothetical protein
MRLLSRDQPLALGLQGEEGVVKHAIELQSATDVLMEGGERINCHQVGVQRGGVIRLPTVLLLGGMDFPAERIRSRAV